MGEQGGFCYNSQGDGDGEHNLSYDYDCVLKVVYKKSHKSTDVWGINSALKGWEVIKRNMWTLHVRLVQRDKLRQGIKGKHFRF